MDTKSKLDTLWKKGVGEMKNLASKADQAATRLAERSAATAPVSVPGEHQRGDASGAEDISREDLLQLTMKLSKRLKSSESSNAALTKEARRFMLERRVAQGVGRGPAGPARSRTPLREGAGSSSEPSAALLDALSARAAERRRRRPTAAAAALKTALEAALAGRDGLATKLRAAGRSLAETAGLRGPGRRASFTTQIRDLRQSRRHELAAKDATIAELAAARDTLTDAKATLAAALAEEARGARRPAARQPPRGAPKLAAAEKGATTPCGAWAPSRAGRGRRAARQRGPSSARDAATQRR
ncbi:hypothetical protein JL721_7756 [Aureococcus anophagefferens]|nr:hypothetical protein JL721_7756 [Aureococcus anophagefferens]